MKKILLLTLSLMFVLPVCAQTKSEELYKYKKGLVISLLGVAGSVGMLLYKRSSDKYIADSAAKRKFIFPSKLAQWSQSPKLWVPLLSVYLGLAAHSAYKVITLSKEQKA